MSRRKGPPRGGKGSGGKRPGDRHLQAVETPSRTVSHIGSDGRRVDTLIPASQPAAPATTPKATAVGLPVVTVRTSPTTAVVVMKKSGQALAKAEPFKLLVEAMGPDSPNVRVSWCLSSATVTDLRDKHKVSVNDTRMLLLVTREVDGMLVEVERRLVALDSPVEYLRFNQPGLHRVHGFIVWSNLGDERKAHAELFKFYCDTDAGNYIKCLTDGMTARIAAHVPKLDHVAEHMVDVPSAFFAKKPSLKRAQWLANFFWWFTNLWFEKGPVDQCVFCKRWLFGTLPKLVMVPPYCILTMLWRGVCSLLLLLLGRRPNYMKLKAIWRPFDYQFAHLIDAPNHRFFEARAYIWLTDRKGRPRDATILPLRIPLLWIGYVVIGYYIANMSLWSGDGSSSLGMAYLWAILLTAIGTVVAWLVIAILLWISHEWRNRSVENDPARQEIARRRADAKARAEAAAEKAKREKQEAERLANYTILIETGTVCDAATESARPPTVWDLPWARRSLRLIFDHTKAKVCKPYSK